MSFTLVSAGIGSPVDPFSLPNTVSIACQDDGSGGTIFINGLGFNAPALANAVDLKTFFGAAAFKSYPLLKAFRKILTATAAAAQNQLVPALAISIYPLVAGLAAIPGVDFTFTQSSTTIAPLVGLIGPSVAGFWRVEMRLRHSITN